MPFRDDDPRSRDPLVRQHLFKLGELHMTHAVRDSVPPSELLAGFRKHANGDWGLVDEKQREENAKYLHGGGVLQSQYSASNGVVFNIATETDRSMTTASLRDEPLDMASW